MLPLAPPAAPSIQLPPAATPGPRFGALLRSQAAAPAATPAPPSTAHPPPNLARTTLVQVERARERLDAMLAAAQRGRTFTAQELLAVQAQAYRYAQTVEVASTIVEQGVQSVKQAVQSQV